MAPSSSFSISSNKEQAEDEWNVVIKVKHGDALRRFSAHVHQQTYAGQPFIAIEYDMNKLRSKILSLFKFSHDATLVLTYTDDDGDVVCLDSDDEFRDAVVNQRLNPLRINVQMKPYTTDGSYASLKNMENSDKKSDKTSPAHDGFHQLATELNSALDKSLKSLPDPVKGILSNLSHEVIQTATSAPVFNELLSLLSKVQLKNDSQSSHEPSGTSMGMSTGVPSNAADLKSSAEPKVPIFSSPFPENIPMKSYDRESAKTSKDQKDDCEVHRDGKSATLPPSISFGSQSDVPGNSHDTPKLFSCPSTLHPYRRTSSCLNYMSRTFHKGVICDGCGMHPIIGPRYKSTVKENYDLCGTCFRDMGRETEYTRIDTAFRFPKAKKHHHKHNHRGRSFPAIVLNNMMEIATPNLTSSFVVDVTVWDGTVMHPGSRFTKIWRMRNTGTVAWPSGTQLVWVAGHNLGIHSAAELEIPQIGFSVGCELDIAVDCVAPSVPGKYMSYWQMESSSGQKFGDEVWIRIQVCEPPSASCACSSTSLNLNLPPESNQQSGPVVIDVESVPLASMPTDDILLNELLKTASEDLLKTPSDFTSAPQPSNDVPTPSFNFISVPQPSKDTLASSSFPSIPTPSSPIPSPAMNIPTSSVVSYPLIDISALSNTPDINYTPRDDLTDENLIELTLLKELEEMGFVQTDLNKDILRQNRYDLEQSVEELCEFAEWDPLLKELQEMGFNDKELNRKLLVKNDGSIKRVVMELVSGKKAE